MVPTIKVKGFRCFLEEAVYSSDKEGYAHLLSLVGSREAVKAVWARLMKGEAAYFEDGEAFRAVRINAVDGGKLLTERLPSGAFHGLLLSKALLAGEVLLCEQETDLPARFYRLLCDRLRLPLHKDWSDWLWEHATAEQIVVKLSSKRLHAFEVHLAALDLEQAVRVALVNRELPEIMMEVGDAA